MLTGARVLVLISALVAVAHGADAVERPSGASRKRGVCANQLAPEDVDALRPGVSWWYNWHFETADASPGLAYQPMVWTSEAGRMAGIKRTLARDPAPRVLLALNEPNLSGQANLDPQKASEAWVEISKLARARGLPLIGPHLAISAPDNEKVEAWDPVKKTRRNLSYMVDYMDAFLHYADIGSIDGIGLHSYGNIGELKWAVEELHKRYGKPVWVTEFAEWNANDAGALADYMIAAVDFMERSPHVAGYAWFKERMESGNTKLALLAPEKGKLTRLGQLYVHMPTHDAAVFFPVPGRIEAESDLRMQGVGLEATNDRDGWFHAMGVETGDWLEYQVEVKTPGAYTLAVRVAGPRPINLRVKLGQDVLGEVTVPSPAGLLRWQTESTTVRLPAGRHVLRIEGGGGFDMNWFELTPSAAGQ